MIRAIILLPKFKLAPCDPGATATNQETAS